MDESNIDRRIPLRGHFEYDVHTGWRHVLCYTVRPGVCKNGKRSYNRRHRKFYKMQLRKDVDEM
jgi:hypothetical protein